jgi:hypothetical protein
MASFTEFHPRSEGDPGDQPSHIQRDAQGGLLAETWFTHRGGHRDASEGPGVIRYDPATAQAARNTTSTAIIGLPREGRPRWFVTAAARFLGKSSGTANECR